MADQLATVAQIKARLQGTGGAGVTWTAADDTLLSELIDQVSDFIQDYTHRKLVPVSSTTYVFDTGAGYVLHVPIGIRTITSLGVNNMSHQPDSGGSYTTVAATDYLLRPKVQDDGVGWPFTQVRLARAAVGTIRTFGDIENGATITGTFGFAVTPPAIVAVTIDAVIAAWQSRKIGASGVMGADDTALVPWNMLFGKGSPQRATLDRFRFLAV